MSASTSPPVTSATATLRIGEVADRTGVSVRSLRYYEQQGLLSSDRTTGGQRRYDDDTVARVQLIQLLFRAGVPSRVVLDILPCIHTGTPTPTMLGLLENERERLAGHVSELAATLARLDDAIVETKARIPRS